MEYKNSLHQYICKTFGDNFTEESFRHIGFASLDSGTYLSTNGNVRIQAEESSRPLPVEITEVAIKTNGEWTIYSADDVKSGYFTKEKVEYTWPSHLQKYSSLQQDQEVATVSKLTDEGQKLVKDNLAREPEVEKVFLATTATGIDVYIESETFEHMQAHPDVDLEVVKEAISKIDDITTETPFRIGSTDLGRTVGKDNCVEINSEDKIEMLYRKNRDGQTPVILNGEKADTSLVTVGICLDQGKHTMFTAFYGQLAPKEPWDERIQNPTEKAEAEKFWSTHALVLEPDAIDWDKSNPTEDKRVENLANDILNKNSAKSEAYIVNPFKVMDEHKQTKTNDNKEERSGKNGLEDISI